jgi:hypothetical protein
VGSLSHAALRANAACLSQLCALLQLPVILLRAPLSPSASEILPEVTRHLPNALGVHHTTNDSWEERSFVDAVTHTGRRQLIFAGIATDVGVSLTALSALRAGYQCALLTDVSGTLNPRVEQAAHLRLAQAGVILTSWSSFAGEIQRDYTKGLGPQVLQILRTAIQGNL